MRERYESALIDSRIVGLSVATRSDCLAPEALDVIAGFRDRLPEVRLEFGLQTTNRATLAAMGCGHTPDDFADTTRRAHAAGVSVVAHVIFGLPGDTPADALACAELVNDLGVEGVKIHNLYLTSDSRLGRQYAARPFAIPSRDEHVALAAEFLARLRPEVVVERLVGDAPADRRLAPDWTIDKRGQWALVEAAMARRDWRQGCLVSRSAARDSEVL